MKNTRKILVAFVVVMTLLMTLATIPAFAAESDKVAIAGSFNGWSTNANTTYDSASGLHTFKVDLEAGDHEFKVVVNGGWLGNGGSFTDTTITSDYNGGWDCYDGGNFYMKATGGTYIFQYNVSTKKVNVVYHTSHDLSVTTTEAGCLVDGSTVETCKTVGCGYTNTTVLTAPGHVYSEGVCTGCGAAEPTVHEHFYQSTQTKAPTCTEKGELTWNCACGEDSYTTEIDVISHSYVMGVCSVCGGNDPDFAYYLVGYINGANYGCEGDYQNLGEYKFVDGQLVATFTADSYVFVKTSDNSHWYLFESYCQTTSGTLIENKSEKMFVPGNVEITFTLVVNEDGTLTLSYKLPKVNMPEGENWIVAGGNADSDTDAGFFTTRWDASSTVNTLTYVNGDYQIVYTGVNKGNYQFKAIKNNSWDTSYPNDNYYLVVEEDNSTVTITVSYGNIVSATVEHVCLFSEATCMAPATCSCGETRGDVVAHTVVHVEAVEADCQTIGNVEHWYCSVCGAAWLDEANTMWTNLMSVKTGYGDHSYDNNCDWECNLCGEYRNAPHTIDEYVAAVVPANCTETGHDEYWICADCGGYFVENDMGGYSETNPAWMNYTGDHVRPEGAIICAVVACELCGEDTYGEACDRGDAPVCQDASCIRCGETVWGWGCNYNTGDEETPLPLCQPGECVYCGTHYEKLYECENGSWAPCSYDGKCSYGCGKQYPATGEHFVDDPCAGGTCWLCWTEIEPVHAYMYPCDARCMNCGELTNEDASHTIVHVEAKAATDCQSWDGNVEYWYCSDCGSAWLDEARTLVTNPRSVVVTGDHSYFYPCDVVCQVCLEETNPEATHTIVHVEAKAGTDCQTWDGNVEYWYCSDCGSAWLDEARTQVTNLRSVDTAGDHSYCYACDAHCQVCYELTNEGATHSIKHVEAVEAECFKTGNIEHWTCELCGGCWDNENATGMPLNAMMVKTYLDHNYVDAICTHCGSQDPTTKAPSYIFTTDSLAPIAQGDVAKGDTLNVGTDGFFTLIFGDKGKVDKSKAEFEDGYVGTQRLHFNGNTKVESNNVSRSIMFTTEGPTTLKVWWKAGKDGRNVEIYTWDGEKTLTPVYSASTETTENSLYITTFEITKAGTYYLGHVGGTCYFYKATLTEHDHEHDFKDVVVAPTCEDKGYTVKVCSTCTFHGEKSDEVAALGHDMVTDAAVAPTCTATGLTEGSHCSRCDEKVAQEEVAALGHDIVTDAAKAPTCTETGLTEGSHCSRCDDEKVAQEEVAALGHDMVTDAAVAPTCATTGLTEGSHCTRCDHKVAQEEVAALGHLYYGSICLNCYGINPNFIFNNVVAGENKVVCNDQHLVANGEGEHGFPYEFPFLTVTEPGYYIITADKPLGVFIYTIEVHTEGADFSVGGESWNSVVLNAAYLEAGTYYLGFVYYGGQGEYKVTVTNHTHVWSDATCTEVQKCACGLTQGEALGHDMVTDAAVAPTCTATGLTEGSHCSRCDHKVAQEEVAALGHDMVLDAAVAPTCTETGLTEGSHCSRCDHKVAQEEVPALGHTFVEGKCECGESDPNYKAPTFFEKIWAAILGFFASIGAFFGNLFKK